MKNKGVFKRVEKKYLLNGFQYRALFEALKGIAEVDAYGETEILNIYYDTPDFHLIRTSLDKPLYKEKLRLRTYGVPRDDSNSFVEIKKKFSGVVYKRRVPMNYADAQAYLDAGKADQVHVDAERRAKTYTEGGKDRGSIVSNAEQNWTATEHQIFREIEFFRERYGTLRPQMVVAYDRIAMFGVNDPELRITFDRNIRWRTEDLDLRHGGYGNQLLQPDQYLMEIKIMGAMPVELAHIMSRLKIFSVSYSKYGSGYRHWVGQQTAFLVTRMLTEQQQTGGNQVGMMLAQKTNG